MIVKLIFRQSGITGIDPLSSSDGEDKLSPYFTLVVIPMPQ